LAKKIEERMNQYKILVYCALYLLENKVSFVERVSTNRPPMFSDVNYHFGKWEWKFSLNQLTVGLGLQLLMTLIFLKLIFVGEIVEKPLFDWNDLESKNA